jgi:hypothetical protein
MLRMRAARIPIIWNEDLPIFASEAFLRTVGDEFGWIGGFADCGTLRCVLPYTILRKPLISLARFRLQSISLGQALELHEEKDFLIQSAALLRSQGADVIVPAPTNAVFRTCPDSAVAAPYGSWVLDLQATEPELFAAVHLSHRRLISKAKKSDVNVRVAQNFLPSAHRILRDTFAASGIQFMSLDSFSRYAESLGQHAKLFIAERRGEIQACALVPFSHASAYYVYGGSAPDAAPGAMHLLQWEMIRFFRSLGVARYDFVGARLDPTAGSKQAGLSLFKQRFGAQLVQGLVWKMGLSSTKFALYNIAYRLMKGRDIVDQELRRLRTDPGGRKQAANHPQ